MATGRGPGAGSEGPAPVRAVDASVLAARDGVENGVRPGQVIGNDRLGHYVRHDRDRIILDVLEVFCRVGHAEYGLRQFQGLQLSIMVGFAARRFPGEQGPAVLF